MTTTRRRGSLAVRIALVCAGAAVVGAVVSGLLAARLVTVTAREAGRDALAAQADVVSGQLDRAAGRPRAAGRVQQALAAQGIDVVTVGAGEVRGAAASILRADDLSDLDGGRPVSAVRWADGVAYLVEGRPSAGGGGVVLVQEAGRASGAVARLAGRVVLAVLVGAGVATAAGGVLAWWVSRPLRAAAGAVGRLRQGHRDVRVRVEGPREAAALAAGINDLADALARSEAREREFLLSVSHDLRTPLTAVTGAAEALADGVVDRPDEVRRYGAVVLEQARRLERMVRDLLDLARLGAHDLAVDLLPVDLGALVRATADTWQDRAAAAGARCLAEVGPGPLVVVTDAARVRQVLDSLCDNAVRHLDSDGVVVVAARAEASGVVLEVRDDGPGLAPEDYAVAFDRGVLARRYRTRRPGGAGLGLSLVRALVTRLGGRVEAGPAPEGGACLRVVLPPDPGAVALDPRAVRSGAAAARRPRP